MPRRTVLLFAVLAAALYGQKYKGPKPPKPDIPYLLHADTLVTTEVAEAKEETRKDEILYAIPGASSPAKTPLASPIFVFQAEKFTPDKLEVYKLESKGGQREIAFSKKKKQTAHPYKLSVSSLGENLYRLEVVESLPNGEYSMTPAGSNQVFCFAVY